jgi:ribosomal protein S8
MKDIFKLLNNVNIGLLHKQKYAIFKPKNKKLASRMLSLLYTEGFILGYFYNVIKNTYNILLNYFKGQYVLGTIKTFNKSTYPVYVKYTDLISIQRFGVATLILSTIKGFLPHYLAMKYKIGGRAICLLQ